MQSTFQGRSGPDLHRTTARVVGVLFLAAFLAYGGGTAVLSSVLDAPGYLSNLASNATQLRIGAILMLVNSLVVAAIGVLMLRVARPHSEVIAFGYLGAADLTNDGARIRRDASELLGHGCDDVTEHRRPTRLRSGDLSCNGVEALTA